MNEIATKALFERFDKLQLGDANEAETRFKLIDRILFDVLDWTQDDITVEDHVSEDGNTEYSDYIVRTGFSSFVIEAKKIGRAELTVPTRRKERLNRRLVSGETGEAIKQARDYCRKLGVQFAVVTNGSQWIIFPALRTDGVRAPRFMPFFGASARMPSSRRVASVATAGVWRAWLGVKRGFSAPMLEWCGFRGLSAALS